MLLVKEMSFPVFQLLELNCLGVYWNSCDQPIATLDAQTMIVSGVGGGGGGGDEGGEVGWVGGGGGGGGGGDEGRGVELSGCVLEFLLPAHCHLGCSDHDCELVRGGGVGSGWGELSGGNEGGGGG